MNRCRAPPGLQERREGPRGRCKGVAGFRAAGAPVAGRKSERRPLTCSSAPGRFGRERGRDRDGLAPGMVLDSGEAFATACGDRGAVVWRNSGGAAARHGGTGRAGAARVLGRRRRWDEEAQGLRGQLKESRASWASVPGYYAAGIPAKQARFVALRRGRSWRAGPAGQRRSARCGLTRGP